MRTILWVFGFFLITLVIVTIAGPKLVDWNQYKDDIQDQVRSFTGRDVLINGDISITIFPAPALIANDVSLANVTGAHAKDLIHLSSLEVKVSLAPLIGGSVKVERVNLVDPVIELEVLSDGRNNWKFEVGASKVETNSDNLKQIPNSSSGIKKVFNKKPKSQKSTLVPSVSLDSLSIENGTLIYRDSIEGTIERIENLNAKFSAATIKGPFESSGKLRARGVPVTFDLNVGEIIHGRTVAFALQLASAPGDLKVLLSGTMVGLGDNPRIKGSVKGEAKSLSAFIKSTQGMSLPKPLGQSFSFDANIAARTDGADIENLELRLDDKKVSGAIKLRFDETLNIAVKLKTGRVDLDQWLTPKKNLVSKLPKKSSGSGKEAPVVLGGKTASKLGKKARFVIPEQVQASLTLTAEVITYRSGVIRNALVNAELSNGEITLSQASAQFPGGSEMALFGFLTVVNDEPLFEGELESTVNDMRGVLSWLGHDLKSVAKDRLRKLTLATRVSVSPDKVDLEDIDFKFDSSKITGGITIALRRRPSFGANISINKLNLDAYLPKKMAAVGNKKPILEKTGLETERKTTSTAPKKKAPIQMLKILNELDANLKIRVNSLRLKEESIKNAVLDGTLYDGSIDIRRLSADQFVGSKLFAKGKISNFGEVPKISALSFKVDSKRVNNLIQFIGLKPIPALKRIKRVEANGKIDGPILAPLVKINMISSGVQAKISGQLNSLELLPSVKKLKVFIKSKDASKLLKIAGINAFRAKNLGAIELDGEINGSLLAPNLVLGINMLGGTAAVSGKINTLPIGDLLDLSLRLSHPNFAHLLRIVSNYNPVGKLGSLDVQGRLIGGGGTLSFKEMIAKAGSADLRGDVFIRLDSKRPKINADLSGRNIIIDPFLPENKSASFWPELRIRPVATRKHFSSWSTQPIDLSRLSGVDAKLTLKSPSIKYKRYNLQDADLSLSLGKGRLVTNKFTGLIFGGLLNATGNATTNSRPRVEAMLVLEKINVSQATLALTGASIAGGKMGMQLNLNSAGNNVTSLINGLNGNGSLQFKDINAKGGNTKTLLAGALGLVSAMNEISGLLGARGKSEGLVDISSSFKIQNGIATSRDMRIVSGIGEGKAKGIIDLPRWAIDVRGDVNLNQNLLSTVMSRGNRGNANQTLPFAVYGKLDSPNIKLDTSKITGGALLVPGADKLLKKLPKGVGGVLQEILGGRKNQQEIDSKNQKTSPQSESQQQKRIDPVDIMKEIFRRR